MKNRFLYVLILIVLIFFIITTSRFYNHYTLGANLTSEQEKRMKDILSEKRPYCMGRYSLDIPNKFFIVDYNSSLNKNIWSASLSWGNDSYRSFMNSKRMYFPAFERFVKDREEELKKIITDDLTDMPYLKNKWSLPEGVKGVIFERNLDSNANDAMRILETYIFSNGVAFKIQKQSIDDSSQKYIEDRKRRGGGTNLVPTDVESIKNLSLRLKGSAGSEALDRSSFCFLNGYISGSAILSERESASFVFRSDSIPGVTLSVSTNNFSMENTNLLKRVGSMEALFNEVNAHVIRKGRYSLKNIDLEEVLLSGVSGHKEKKRYLFDAYVNETKGSPDTPFINIRLSNLNNSDVPDTGYEEAELVYLWDEIIKSLKLR